MSKADYTQVNLNKQTAYVIVVNPENKSGAFQTTMEVAKEYVKQNTPPKVVIIADGHIGNVLRACSPDEIKTIPYYQVQTFKRGTIRLADRSSEQNNAKVIKKVSSLMKNSMIIVDGSFKFDNEMAASLLDVKGKAQDYIIHRNEIKLLDSEIEYIRKVYADIENHNGNGPFIPEKNIILRLHDYEEFPFNISTLVSLIEYFGEMHAYNILVAYFVCRKRAILLKQAIMKICRDEDENPADFINPIEFNKQVKNHAYYNLITGRIMDADSEFVEKCRTELTHLLHKSQQKN